MPKIRVKLRYGRTYTYDNGVQQHIAVVSKFAFPKDMPLGVATDIAYYYGQSRWSTTIGQTVPAELC